jgi:hypothetical protein
LIQVNTRPAHGHRGGGGRGLESTAACPHVRCMEIQRKPQPVTSIAVSPEARA